MIRCLRLPKTKHQCLGILTPQCCHLLTFPFAHAVELGELLKCWRLGVHSHSQDVRFNHRKEALLGELIFRNNCGSRST
jgi:hypothetical protein